MSGALAPYKHPRTIQEMRAAEAIRTDIDLSETLGNKLLVRACRTTLPTAWDDRVKSSYGKKIGWKDLRMTQFR